MEIAVSIIIPTYNRKSLLKRSIESVLNQTYKKFEIIIIDNNSSDGTYEYIKELNEDKIKFFKINNNGVIAKSRNYGIKKASGKFIAFLDSDDWWHHTKLEKCIKYINDYDFIYHNMIEVAGNKKRKLRLRSLRKPPFNDLIKNGNSIMTSSVFTKKEALIDSQYFNESDFCKGWEDYELWLKIAKNNYSFKRLNSFLGFYHIGDDNFDNPLQALKNISLIEKYFIEKLEINFSNIWWTGYAKGRLHSSLGDYKISNTLLLNTFKRNKIPFVVFLKIIYTFSINFLKSNKIIKKKQNR